MQFKQLCYKNYDTCVDVMKEKMIYKDKEKYQAVNTLISAVKFEHGSPCWSRWCWCFIFQPLRVTAEKTHSAENRLRAH